jgi:hypothetical protein
MGVVRMPFGKHKGTPLINLPDGYLDWGCSTLMKHRKLHAALMEELHRRETGAPPPTRKVAGANISKLSKEAQALFEEYVKQGYLAMAKRYHPDRGGTPDNMLAIQEVREWLESFAA